MGFRFGVCRVNMATGLVASTRSRATERVNRISVNLDRSSGYLLGNNLNALPTSATLRRTRESSLGALGRSNYDSGSSSVRIRESSLTRGGRLGAADTVRNSIMIPTNMETAKFNREQEMKEIHSNFMKQYENTKARVNDEPVDTERRSKAYQRIINNEAPSYMSEYEAKKACVSEMFMDTSKFSTKTLSAINGLEGAVLRKKDKEYNWRKEMDDYEKRAEFERDVRARNVSALHRDDKTEDHWVAQRKTEDRKRQSYETAEKPTEKVAKKDSEAVKSWREKREAERAVEKAEPEPEKKSWREKLAEKQKQEEEKKQREADAEAAAAMSKAAREKALAASAEASSADENAKPANAQAEGENAEEEEEDHNGTKQLKSDVGFLFSGLEQEFAAGQSKLAKLRERIKKAKTAIKEADDGDKTEENKESEAEKDKRRAELREKFRLQREAKKKAQAEAQN